MKCPLEILDEFSEWSNTCQECQHYQECMNKVYDLDKQEPRDSNKEYHTYQCPECKYTISIAEEDDSIDAGHKCPHCIRKLIIKDINRPVGDNYPVFEDIHHKLDLNRNRKKMVIKLLNEDTPKITKDDITDIGIDIELYNKQCRKEKMKRQYKQRTGKDDNV
jgi:DNA-directed RNA polymerase subunit RPC12/RpoP